MNSNRRDRRGEREGRTQKLICVSKKNDGVRWMTERCCPVRFSDGRESKGLLNLPKIKMDEGRGRQVIGWKVVRRSGR